MASILRSSKFARYIAGFARNIVVNTPREFDGSIVNTTQCLCGAVQRTLASQASTKHEQNLEGRLRTIDQDVRRSGRISRRDIEDVLEEIRSSRSATSSQSLLVIRCCGSLVPEELPEVRTKLVQEIWHTLKKLNVPMDISHYNALLRVYLENEHQFSPTDFLTELESKGLEPNRVTYQRLISRYCQIGDIEGATKILEYMREKQLPVNENVFNALITGHSQAGDMDSAQGILVMMSQTGLEPSADTYTTLLCGYANKGDIESITKILADCETKEVHLLDKDFLDIIYALTTHGHSQHVPAMLERVKKAIGYSQDAINLILRLINKGHTDTAFTILETIPRSVKPDGSVMSIGAFFVRQMVKADRGVEEIVKYCELLEESKMYEGGLLLAAEKSLEVANEKLAYKLFDKLIEKNLPIRQHYFWPLLVAKSEDPSGDAVIKVLQKMADYNLTPTGETIREYVIPNIKGKSSEIIAKLREANISLGASACSLVHTLLLKRDLQEAAFIVSTIPAHYNPDLLRRPLTTALYATENVDHYVKILRRIVESSTRTEHLRDVEKAPVIDKTTVLCSLLMDVTTFRNFHTIAETLCKRLVEEGLSISMITAEKIQEKLGEKMTPTTADLLAQLSSGELRPVPLTKAELPSYVPANQMNIPQLELLISNLEGKNGDTTGLKRQLLTLYHRSKELEKMETLLKSLEKDKGFKYSAGICAQLMDTYAYHDNIEQASYYMKKIFESDPNAGIGDSKIIQYTFALLRAGRYDEALEFLGDEKLKRLPEEKNFGYTTTVWKMLNHLAEQGKVEELDQLFEKLVKGNYIDVNNVILGPLVKVHIINDDLAKAIEKFEWCCNQYRMTPMKNELTCKLIQGEDAERLQKLTDISTTVHGEINSLYDLVFAFVECGRIRQARKILETPGLQSRPQRINAICQRYQNEGLVTPLEGLKDATKDLNHIDRSDIYYQLLLTYVKQDDPNKALGLWTQMQEEDLTPSERFMYKLGSYLKEKNLAVPFVMPETKPEPVPQQKRKVQTFKQNLIAGNLENAWRTRGEIQTSVTEQSIFLEKLIQAQKLKEATTLCMEMLERKQLPMARIFRFFLNKLANAGDVESLDKIDGLIEQETKKLVSLDNRICHANLVAGKAAEYLENLEREIDEAKDENLAYIGEKFPRGGAVGILDRHPELTEKFEQIAQKYSTRGIIAPYNVLWSQYFIKGEDEKADEIWSKYLQGAPRIMFQRVVQTARETNNTELIEKLISHLKTSKVTEGAIGNAYSCLLDVLFTKNEKEATVEAFERAVKEVPIETINRTAVVRVKDVYDRLGKPFNHKIPNKSKKDQSSSSSSEDQKR